MIANILRINKDALDKVMANARDTGPWAWMRHNAADAATGIIGELGKIPKDLNINVDVNYNDPGFTPDDPAPIDVPVNYDDPGYTPPDIPAMAKGGVVKTATHAIVGEAGPEAIAPLDTLKSWLGDVSQYMANRALGGSDTGSATALIPTAAGPAPSHTVSVSVPINVTVPVSAQSLDPMTLIEMTDQTIAPRVAEAIRLNLNGMYTQIEASLTPIIRNISRRS